MNIQLDENWKVESDDYQYVLYQCRAGKKGTSELWKKRYYPTLGMALESFVEGRMLDSGASTLKEVQSLIIELKSLKTALSSLKQQYDS